MGEIEEIKAKARDEGYQTGKSDAFKEAKMLVGTYGVKDIDSEETKIYIRAREEAIEQLRKYEPHCGNWSWQDAYKEIQSLQERNRVLTEALEEIFERQQIMSGMPFNDNTVLDIAGKALNIAPKES